MISRVISGVTILITHIRGLITPLITALEPPSMDDSRLHFLNPGMVRFATCQELLRRDTADRS